MNNLPNLLGRKIAAGNKKLAAFFLLFAFVITAYAQRIPYTVGGKLYILNNDYSTTAIDFYGPAGFVQRGVCKSKKDNYVLAWNQKTQELININSKNKVANKTPVAAAAVYINEDFILTQSSNFDENRGFEFTLYKLKYSKLSDKISLKIHWKGFIDCFISDCVFLKNGICIAGGTKDNSKHNVYTLTKQGIHKSFSMPKNGDFLRLIKAPESEDLMYAFISGRDKSKAEPALYSFELAKLSDGTSAHKIEFSVDQNLPSGFTCFFGYGFTYKDRLMLPASVDGKISFIKYDPEVDRITSVIPNTNGCNFPLGITDKNDFIYIARDPLIEGAFYGIGAYNGNVCRTIEKFN